MARLIRSASRGETTRHAEEGRVMDAGTPRTARPARSVRSARSRSRMPAQGAAGHGRPIRRTRRGASAASTAPAPSTPLERYRRRTASAQTMTRILRRFGGGLAAIVFLLLCMLASLQMRTQMVQDSFTVSKLNTSIAMLRQDVEDRQTRLDALNAQLPEKAGKLGLVVSDTSVQVDLTKPAPSSSKDSQ